MDFFASQDKARRQTGLLVTFFVLAVVMMIAGIYFATAAMIVVNRGYDASWWQPDLFMAVSGGTVAVIAIGSLYKTFELRGGGASVATSLGGRKIDLDTTDPDQRRVLHVVEEMAIAAGTAVPPVYLLTHELAINAFAAGMTPDDAVIGISQGAMNHLTRDELQGVVAHEFSHILNGDMRFNMRLIGMLHGILLISLIGYYILRFSGFGIYDRHSRRNRKSDGVNVLLLVGIILFVLGGIGLFFSRLIKAAVARQREYLADASAVQFTRNPDGIGGALKKIGGLAANSLIRSPEAESASHLFFGRAVRGASLFATHPPLTKRIERILPGFDGTFPRLSPKPQTIASERDDTSQVTSHTSVPDGTATPRQATRHRQSESLRRLPLDPLALVAAVGLPSRQSVDEAETLLTSLPAPVRQALRDPFGSVAVVCGLLLDRNDEFRVAQLTLLKKRSEPLQRETLRLWPHIVRTDRKHWLPILEIAQGTLRELSSPQYRAFRTLVASLIEADQRVNLFEFVLRRSLLLHLDRVFGLSKPPTQKFFAVSGLADEANVILSSLAHLGRMDESEEAEGFARARAYFDPKGTSTLLNRRECSFERLDAALERFSAAAMPVKKRLIAAATACIAFDGEVTVGEAELLRSICGSLDCPMPPITAS